jgi:hypothetical protein
MEQITSDPGSIGYSSFYKRMNYWIMLIRCFHNPKKKKPTQSLKGMKSRPRGSSQTLSRII